MQLQPKNVLLVDRGPAFSLKIKQETESRNRNIRQYDAVLIKVFLFPKDLLLLLRRTVLEKCADRHLPSTHWATFALHIV